MGILLKHFVATLLLGCAGHVGGGGVGVGGGWWVVGMFSKGGLFLQYQSLRIVRYGSFLVKHCVNIFYTSILNKNSIPFYSNYIEKLPMSIF